MALYVGRRQCGLVLSVLGEAAGIANYYAVAQAIRGVARRSRTAQGDGGDT